MNAYMENMKRMFLERLNMHREEREKQRREERKERNGETEVSRLRIQFLRYCAPLPMATAAKRTRLIPPSCDLRFDKHYTPLGYKREQ